MNHAHKNECGKQVNEDVTKKSECQRATKKFIGHLENFTATHHTQVLFIDASSLLQ